MKRVVKIINRHSFNPVSRILERLEEYDESKLTKKQKELIDEKYRKLRGLQFQFRFLGGVKMALFVVLYVSLISALFGDVILIKEAVGLIARVSGAISSVFIFVLIAFINSVMRLYTADAHMFANYIIAVSIKNLKK